jgi:hypothetical protein
MKHEERIPMKLFKTICSNALVFFASVVAVVLFLTIVGQALALGFYMFLLIAAAGGLVFLLTRSPD